MSHLFLNFILVKALVSMEEIMQMVINGLSHHMHLVTSVDLWDDKARRS